MFWRLWVAQKNRPTFFVLPGRRRLQDHLWQVRSVKSGGELWKKKKNAFPAHLPQFQYCHFSASAAAGFFSLFHLRSRFSSFFLSLCVWPVRVTLWISISFCFFKLGQFVSASKSALGLFFMFPVSIYLFKTTYKHTDRVKSNHP